MKKGLKYTLVSFGSLGVLAGVGLGIMYVVSPYKVKRWVGISSSYSGVFIDRLKGLPYTYHWCLPVLVIATILLRFYAYSCRKVSKDDKFAAKSNNFWDFMLDIVEKVLTLQRIWEDKRFLADKTVKDHRAGRWEIIGLERSIPSFP